VSGVEETKKNKNKKEEIQTVNEEAKRKRRGNFDFGYKARFLRAIMIAPSLTLFLPAFFS